MTDTQLYRYFFIQRLSTYSHGLYVGSRQSAPVGLWESFHSIDYFWVLAHAMLWSLVSWAFFYGVFLSAIPRFAGVTLRRPRFSFSTLPLS